MSFSGDVKDSIRTAFCNGFSTADKAFRLGAGLLYPDAVDGAYPGTPGGRGTNAGIALFCDRPPFPAPTPDPISGSGFCVTSYRVDWTSVDNRDPANPRYSESTTGNGHPGPITNLNYLVYPGNGYRISLTNGNGLNVVIAQDLSTTRLPTATNIRLVRLDGLPDNCGPEAPPPEPLSDGDRTYDIDIDNSTGPILFLPPVLNINGDLSVPFNFDVGELNLSGTVELNTGDITLNFGGQPTDSNAPKVPTPDDNPPPGEDDNPEPEKQANIIGVIVISSRTADVSATEIPGGAIPNIFVPRIASVAFKVRIGNKGHWTTDLPVKSRNAYIPCPGEIDAIEVAALVEKGWSSVLVPVRGFVPSNQVVLV